MTPYTLILAAGAEQPVHAQGRRFFVRSTTGAVDISTADKRIAMTGVLAGEGHNGAEFPGLLVKNPGASSVTVELVISDDEFFSNRFSLSGGVNVSDGHTNGNATVGVAASMLGGVAGQIRITVRAALTNTGTITFGTVAGTGIPLAAGESREIATSAAIDLIASAATQTLHYQIETA